MRAGARKQALVPAGADGARAGRHRARAARAVPRSAGRASCPGRRASCRRCGRRRSRPRRCASCWRGGNARAADPALLPAARAADRGDAARARRRRAAAGDHDLPAPRRARGGDRLRAVGGATPTRRSRPRCASATATCCSPTTARRSTRSSRGCSPGATIATAESCTGGLMAGRLTDLAGSSAYVLGGLVVYSNEAKTALAGVPAALIEAHGAVSPEVATRAVGGRALAPGGGHRHRDHRASPARAAGSPEKPVGTVCLSSRVRAPTPRSAPCGSRAAAPTSATARPRSRCTCCARCCCGHDPALRRARPPRRRPRRARRGRRRRRPARLARRSPPSRCTSRSRSSARARRSDVDVDRAARRARSRRAPPRARRVLLLPPRHARVLAVDARPTRRERSRRCRRASRPRSPPPASTRPRRARSARTSRSPGCGRARARRATAALRARSARIQRRGGHALRVAACTRPARATSRSPRAADRAHDRYAPPPWSPPRPGGPFSPRCSRWPRSSPSRTPPAPRCSWGSCVDFRGVALRDAHRPARSHGRRSRHDPPARRPRRQDVRPDADVPLRRPGRRGPERDAERRQRAPELESRFRLIGYDQRGTGRSGLLRCPELEKDPHLRSTSAGEDCAEPARRRPPPLHDRGLRRRTWRRSAPSSAWTS